jgi:hypothetical protein
VWSIAQIRATPDLKINLGLADGTFGVAELSPRLSQGLLGDGFDLLCNDNVFSKMYQHIRATVTAILAPKRNRVAQEIVKRIEFVSYALGKRRVGRRA